MSYATSFIGVDLAVAKGKFLPVVVCTLERGRLLPEPLRAMDFPPPRGIGNVACLDEPTVRRFAREARDYIIEVCRRRALKPKRIGIDAPSAPRGATIPRRLAECALDKAEIRCFTTPSEAEFNVIRTRVKRHLASGGAQSQLPHANQLWMLAGFALFAELANVAPCIEVFPQATARALGAGSVHKSRAGAVEVQLEAASRHTLWPKHKAGEPEFAEIAWAPDHDKLDAYLSAWVASLPKRSRRAYGRGPDDVIWAPDVPASSNHNDGAPMACPACRTKHFRRWPWGWDAHAAHSCTGLMGRDPLRRKAEFKRRFGKHF